MHQSPDEILVLRVMFLQADWPEYTTTSAQNKKHRGGIIFTCMVTEVIP